MKGQLFIQCFFFLLLFSLSSCGNKDDKSSKDQANVDKVEVAKKKKALEKKKVTKVKLGPKGRG